MNSVIPDDEIRLKTKRRYLYLTFYELLLIVCTAAVPIVICIYTAIDNKQKFTEAGRRRQFDLEQSEKLRQQEVYDKFIEDFYKLDKDGQLNDSAKPWAFANARYWSANRQLNPPLKVDALVFFKQKGLIGRRCRHNDNRLQVLEDVIKLNGLNFDHVQFKSPTNGLVPLDMTCVNFDQVSLSGSVFGSTNLNEATFEGSRLTGATFHDSSLVGTVFNRTEVDGVNFGNADLQNTQFIGVDLSKTLITEEQLAKATLNNSTLSNGVELADSSAKPTSKGYSSVTTELPTKMNPSKYSLTSQTTLTKKQTTVPLTTTLLTSQVIFQNGTRVSGPIQQNTQWTKAKSPFYIIGDVQVTDKITLTIEAGVRIIYDMAGDFELLVRGYLQVQGTPIDQVIFDGSTMIKANKSMISFKGTNLSQSLITSTLFIGPRKSVTLAELSVEIPFNKGDLTVQHCRFQDTEINTHSTIFDSKFNSTIPRIIINDSILINSTVSNGREAPQLIEIRSSHLQNVIINALAHYNSIRMIKCRGTNVQISWDGVFQTGFEISDTTLKNIWLTSYSSTVSSDKHTSFIIQRSMLENATLLTGRAVSYGSTKYLNITSSNISINRAIEIELGSIHCSIITSFDNHSSRIGIIANSVSIVDSSIYNFDIGLRIEPYDKSMVAIINSNFYQNALYNIQNLGALQVNAIGNWWGTNTSIHQTLYDYQDNINYGRIIFDRYSQYRIEHGC